MGYSRDEVERITLHFRRLLILVAVQTPLWCLHYPRPTYILYTILVRVTLLCLLTTIHGLELITAFKLARQLRMPVPFLWAIALALPFFNLPGLLVFAWKVGACCRLHGAKLGWTEIAKGVAKAVVVLASVWLSYNLSENFSTRALTLFLLGLALSAGLLWVLYGRWKLVVTLWLIALFAQFSPIDVRPKHWTGRPALVPTMTGLPSTETVLAADRNEVWLNGCVVDPHAPKWVVTW